jgi:nucleotide-binding universal stress UspA family protein
VDVSGDRPIVVGLDDSHAAQKALRFAIEEGRIRRRRVVAVHAYDLPALIDAPEALVPTLLDDLRRSSERFLDAAVSSVGDGATDIERRSVSGHPSTALIAASADAELLVVGSRGRGGFAGLLLGSVSQQCAQHAACPVAIVPVVDDDPGNEASGP